MIKRFLLLLAITLIACTAVEAQDFTKSDTLRYVDATQFRIINNGFDDPLYSRLPKYMEDSVRDGLWWLARCSAGIGIRFATDSRCVAMHYNIRNQFHMAHMADTGTKGVDLYILDEDDGKWHFVNCNRPTKDSIQTKVFIDRLDGRMHEYLAYLSLYDGVNWIDIGVDSTAVLTMPQVVSPRVGGKVVFYGTSIMQGGCATRPGMVSTNILQRELGVECVNLGFSGQAKMDSCMARVMAAIPDVAAYVLDPVPNCTKMMCDTLTYGFVNILRTLRPDVPIIMVEGPMYSYTKYSAYYSSYLPEKNVEWRKNYERLLADNPDNLYYVDCEGLYGPDGEGFVDGIHATDVGFLYYAAKLLPVLKQVIK